MTSEPLPSVHRFPYIIFPILAATALADDVILNEGSRLSGTVTAMNPAGELSLESPLSFEPFHLRPEGIKRVEFSTPKTSIPDEHDAMLVLANGDQFACDLKAVDGDSVQVHTAFAGDLDIPRPLVGTVQLGVKPRKTIYKGPQSDNGWTIRNGWRFDGNMFVTDGNGTLARRFETPGSYAIKFRLAWRNTPNIQIFFADDLMETTGRTDRYHLSFDGSGLQLKRQIRGDSYPNKDMHSLRMDPADFSDSQIEIELRVDRKLSLVHLYVNGQPEGKYADPMKETPAGQGLMFYSKIAGDEIMTVQDLEIREWDASADRHRSETRGDETKDVVITRTSDRSTGEILGLKDDKVLYKSPHYPEPVELHTSEISTLFFARKPDQATAKAAPLKLDLRLRASLSIAACEFADDHFKVTHPLLGELEVKREAVARLDRKPVVEEPEEPEPEEAEEE
ncbi:hypothetical protein OJ996_10020 [Luteolibacter sp. GHJ8]|uniref:Polysaccharide lyase-like protein n=1 Tax=Luteolibacter rhizosphaerae TaxID=2989719 RepID=A0ABT3G252_9BACT|nr:hypothetical protein [Luteolibacter rhizosphaerae]MCW1913912.1 hypothetical protein [Luteolibacter rhizosphaerae]